MRPVIIAHRGASNLCPENTLASFRTAKALGADGIEFDVQLTKDKRLVVAHDYMIDFHTGVRGDIYNMTFDELRRLDFGSWKSPEFANERIPTIEEALEVGRDMQIVQMELKSAVDQDPDFVPRVVDTVVDAGMTDKVMITAFNHDLLRQVKEYMPEIRVGALTLWTPSTIITPSPAVWEDLGLKQGDDLLEKLSGPQAVGEAVALLEDEQALEEENSALLYYLKDRVTALTADHPGENLYEIIQSFGIIRDLVSYVKQLTFPIECLTCEYHSCFKDTTLVRRVEELGLICAPWPGFEENRQELRSLVEMAPHTIVTNKPELLTAILVGSGQM